MACPRFAGTGSYQQGKSPNATVTDIAIVHACFGHGGDGDVGISEKSLVKRTTRKRQCYVRILVNNWQEY